MSRTSKRLGTKSKVIPGTGTNKPPKYRFSQRTKHHRRKPVKG